METPDSLAFVDLETTGGNPGFHRITEIGIVRWQNGVLLEAWSSLVNPECPISPYIEAFTGISSEMVADAPRFAEIASLVRAKLGGVLLVAHNARFDYSFLRSEFRRAGMAFAAPVLCTVRLSRRLFPGAARHNLDAVMQRHGLICAARHRALGDAQVLHDLWLKLKRDVSPGELADAAAHAMLAEQALPAHLPAGLADELPDAPGVYRCFGADGELLYVGRSNSLRARVLEQLGAGRPGSREHALAAEVRRVDWRQTAGELGAMLLEAHWIRTQRPQHNRHPKSQSEAVTLQPAADGCGKVLVRRIDELLSSELAQCFGIFHSEKDARKALTAIAGAQQLCLKVLGLEDSAGSCFARQMGRCRGACSGGESTVLHAMRAHMALSKLKIKTWPFPGRIALRERAVGGFGADGSRGGEYHVLDQWAYLGSARSEEELGELAATTREAVFDVSVYKLLQRYLANHSRLDWRELRRPAAVADVP